MREVSAGTRVFFALLVGVAIATLAACETGPVYKPKGPGERVGYTDQQLAANRYRITFSGNNATPRDQVENYLLRRASEVTVQSGFTHFIFDTRDTEAKTYYRTDFDPWAVWGGPFGMHGRAWYWSNWPAESTTTPITRYEAYAEIVMLTAAQAAKDPLALSASDVLSHLNPPPPPQHN